jgi:homoserine dehydrogenase
MSEDGAQYADALAEAQRLGFAEPDPTADVEGLDAGAKLAIVASIAFGASVVADDVHHEGISSVTVDDISFAHRLGYEVKLLAVAEQDDDGRIAVRVHPAMVPRTHPLAAVRDAFNAVFVEGDAVGPLMFYGRGAGGAPTASALLGDLVDAATNLGRGSASTVRPMPPARIRPMSELRSEYYVDLEVLDQPGVLHAVSGVFAEHDVSIRSMEQEGLGAEARLVFITHEAGEAAMQATLAELRTLEVVDRVASVLRVVS